MTMVAPNDDASSANTISSSLQRTAGIYPSEDWIGACHVHLQETGSNDSSSAADDSILHQVLHADLRDVVDRSAMNGNSRALRQAVQQSTSQQHEKVIRLPQSFRLMVQVEEVLDVSVNAETRLSVGPASRTGPTAVGNQHSRCLKLYLTDGYPLVVSSSENTRRAQHLIAMEVPPLLSDLSVHSHAGCKVLLRGPLDIRLGVIFLHAGCATVLGGSVEDLVNVQKKALEQAQRVAGVGVDPTVRALIWNPLTGMEEEQDEGEQESGDVVAVPQPPAPSVTAISRAVMPPPAARIPSSLSSSTTVATTSRSTVIPPSVGATGSNARTTRPAAPQHRTTQSTPAPPSRHVPVTSASSSSSSSTGPRSNPYSNNNPYSQHRPVVIQTGTSSRTTTNMQLSSSSQETIDLTTPTNHNEGALRNAFVLEDATTVTTGPAQALQQRQHDLVYLSFAELRGLMERIRVDEELYRQHEHKIFVVSCKMTGSHRYFNILKKKKYNGKTKGEKYEYVMRIGLCASNAVNSTLTATISSDILATCFPGPSPGEVRAMSKKDKNKTGPGTSNYIVGKGGAKASKLFAKEALWCLQLVNSAKEFFCETPIELDGENAMLKILRKHEGT